MRLRRRAGRDRGDRPGDSRSRRPGRRHRPCAHAGRPGTRARPRRGGVRLVQTAYHYRSLALYAKLGFVVREPLSVLQGAPPPLSLPGLGVRAAREEDVAACGDLCARVHGHDRSGELRDAIAAGTAAVVERPGRISGYATGFGYGWHAVAETNEDLIALLGSAEAFMGLGILVPSRNAELLSWCLAHGLRIVQQSTLMTIGLYSEPVGAYLPSDRVLTAVRGPSCWRHERHAAAAQRPGLRCAQSGPGRHREAARRRWAVAAVARSESTLATARAAGALAMQGDVTDPDSIRERADQGRRGPRRRRPRRQRRVGVRRHAQRPVRRRPAGAGRPRPRSTTGRRRPGARPSPSSRRPRASPSSRRGRRR